LIPTILILWNSLTIRRIKTEIPPIIWHSLKTTKRLKIISRGAELIPKVYILLSLSPESKKVHPKQELRE
jgi:hypothetical protein